MLIPLDCTANFVRAAAVSAARSAWQIRVFSFVEPVAQNGETVNHQSAK